MSAEANSENKAFWEIGEFLSHEFDEPQAYCASLIYPKGLMVVGGEPKTGKSNFVFNLAFALGSGSAFLNFDIPAPYKVLVIQAELSEGRLQERMRMISGGWENAENKVFVATLRGAFLNDPAGFAAIKKIVDDAAPDVIIIDPLVEFFSGDENKAIEMRALLDRLNLLIENTNRSIILTHHLRKPSRDGGGSDFNALRGSSVLFGRIDTGILILPELDGQIKVDFICRNAGKPEKIIASFDENLVIKYIKQAGAKKVHDAMILDLLKEGGKVRIKEVAAKVAAAADCRETTAKEHIRTLIEAGRIKKEGMTKNATIELVD